MHAGIVEGHSYAVLRIKEMAGIFNVELSDFPADIEPAEANCFLPECIKDRGL